MRLVLDTNIWLDWLVFGDHDIAPIKAAVGSVQAEISIDAACEQELARVLTYPLRKKALDAALQAACLAECRRLTQCATMGAHEIGNAGERDLERLPVCRDPSDQKFLELARDRRADFLVTRDLALLALARRKIRRVPFRIVTPRQFTYALGSKS